jgi:surface antigen
MRFRTPPIFALAAAPAVALAFDLTFLDQAPIRYMNDDDIGMMQATVLEVLDQAKDGEERGWRNDKTGNSGSVTAIKSFSEKGLSCRGIQIDNRAPEATQGGAISTHELCKVGDEWKILR